MSSSRKKPHGWDELANWYNGWVGENGSEFHRKIAIPELLKLLKPQKDEKILDVGAGQGVLAPYIHETKADYTGVEVSEQLLKYAQQYHKDKGRFVRDDALQMPNNPALAKGSFDAAVFLLSIQDMNPLEPIIGSTRQMLKPNSRIVLMMTHPAFRIPRQSGWGYDENRKLTYRRIDRYVTPLDVPMKQYTKRSSGTSISFHRPIQDYVNALSDAGFYTTRMSEITIDKNFELRQNRSKSQTKADAEIPIFLGILAQSFLG